MDIDKLRTLYRVDASSPSGVVFNGNRKRGTGKDGQPALAVQKRSGSGMLYWASTYTDRAAGLKAVSLFAHRVVFALTYGYWPETVDHKDGNGLNNDPLNLRAATIAQQQYNKGVQKRSKTGVKGVTYEPWKNHTNPWLAKCKGKYLGMYHTKEEAAAAYAKEAALVYGEFNRLAC